MKRLILIHEFSCDSCGTTRNKASFYATPQNWIITSDGKHLCHHCKRLRGKKPHNLSPEELRRSVMTFPAELLRKQKDG